MMRRRDPAAGCLGRSAPASASVRMPGRRPRPLRLRRLRVHVLRGLGPADRRDPGPAEQAGAGRGAVTVPGVELLAAPGSGSPTTPGAVGTLRPDAPDRSGRRRPRGGSDRRCSAVRGVGVVVRVVADRVACPAVVGTGCLAVVRQAVVVPDCVADQQERRLVVVAWVPDSAAADRAATDRRGAACSADLARSSDQMYATWCARASFTWCTASSRRRGDAESQPTHDRWSWSSAYPMNATTSITACAMTSGHTLFVSW